MGRANIGEISIRNMCPLWHHKVLISRSEWWTFWSLGHWQVRDVDYGQKTDTQHCCVLTNDNDRYLKLHYVWIRNEQVGVNSCVQQWTYQLLTVCAPRGELEDWIWNLRRVQLLHLSEQQHNISWVSMNNINQLLLVSHLPIVSHQDYTFAIYSPGVQVVDQVRCQEWILEDLLHDKRDKQGKQLEWDIVDLKQQNHQQTISLFGFMSKCKNIWRK